MTRMARQGRPPSAVEPELLEFVFASICQSSYNGWMRAAKEKMFGSSFAIMFIVSVALFVIPTAATANITKTTTVYDFTTCKISKLHYGSKVVSLAIVLLETQPNLHAAQRFTTIHLEQLHQGPGLYYFRARYYSPTLGRFTSRDPLGFVDGTSLYRAYFVPTGVDPSGTVKIKCRCSGGSVRQGTDVRYWKTVECNEGANKCCRRACRRTGVCWSGEWEIVFAKPDVCRCDFGYWDYVCAWESPTQKDGWMNTCKWVSFGVGGTAGAAAGGFWVCGYSPVIWGGSCTSSVTCVLSEGGHSICGLSRAGQVTRCFHWGGRNSQIGKCITERGVLPYADKVRWWNTIRGIPCNNPGAFLSTKCSGSCLGTAIRACFRGIFY